MKSILVGIAAAVLAAVPVHAQHAAGAAASQCALGPAAMDNHGAAAAAMHGATAESKAAGGTMHDGMSPWAHEFMAFAHHAKDYGLSDGQSARIERIRTDAEASCSQHMAMAMKAHDAATAAYSTATPDMAAVEKAIRDAHTHAVLAQIAVAKAAVAALEVLTPEQRKKAAAERAGFAAPKARSGH